jgi:hypothetical protein
VLGQSEGGEIIRKRERGGKETNCVAKFGRYGSIRGVSGPPEKYIS